MEDLNTRLANHAVTCQGRAEECTRTAERHEKNAKRFNGAGTVQGMGDDDRKKADDARGQAAAWTARGKAAKEGFFLRDGSDPGYSMAHQDLASHAAREGRMRHQ